MTVAPRVSGPEICVQSTVASIAASLHHFDCTADPQFQLQTVAIRCVKRLSRCSRLPSGWCRG